MNPKNWGRLMNDGINAAFVTQTVCLSVFVAYLIVKWWLF